MDNVKGKFENGILTIAVSGHIDSNNAPEVEKEMEAQNAEHAGADIIVDAEALSYISSAGLRVLLRMRKKNDNMKVINASSELYEIFEMTGFTEIMTIEKAYRHLSVEGCEVIGQGANGKVYRLDPDTIIKVYLRPDCLDEIQRERELARKAFVLGIPTAIPYDVVKVGDNYGSVFELLNASSFSKLISDKPGDVMLYIKPYVELLKKIHSTEVKPGDLPDMNKIAVKWVNDLKGALPDDQWEKLYSLISAIPEDNHMLHGDYHMKNIMMQNGEVLLIDMDTLAAGNPVYEFAFIYNAYIGFEETLPKEKVGEFLGLPGETEKIIWDETVKMYFEGEDEETIHRLTEQARVISYTRILRRTLKRSPDTDDGKKIIANCREKLAYLLPRVKKLAF